MTEKTAILELDNCVNKISNGCGCYRLNQNRILFVYNCTYLHWRTTILDMKRVLTCIRFQSKGKRMFANNFNNYAIWFIWIIEVTHEQLHFRWFFLFVSLNQYINKKPDEMINDWQTFD